MTPILKHLHKHFPAAWKQAEPNPNPDALSLWFEDTDACAYLEIGESRLYVRWPKGIGYGGQYGVGGWFRVCSRKELNASLPSTVASVALNEAKFGRPVPTVPEWAKQELLVQGADRLADFKQKAASARLTAERLEAECVYYSAALTLGA